MGHIFHVSYIGIVRHLKSFGYVNHYDVWVPYDLRRKKLLKLISISDPLLKCNKNNPFFQRTQRKKKLFRTKKVPGKTKLVCIQRWCSISGGIGQALCITMLFLKIRCRIQANYWPIRSIWSAVRTMPDLASLLLDVLLHLLYSLYLAPSDYHLFQPLQNSLHGKNLFSGSL